MANGHVEIYDPFSGKNRPKSNAAGSDDDDGSDGMEGTPEFRLLMVYAKRRRDEQDGGPTPEPDRPTEVKPSCDKGMGKKKKSKRFRKFFFRCIKPKTTDEDEQETSASPPDPEFRVLNIDTDKKDELEDAADELVKIADEIPFIPSELEADSPEGDNVEKLVGLLLREAGDRFNERELKNMSFFKDIIWNYRFYKMLMNELLSRMGLSSADPDSPGPHASTKTQIAVTCEATSRLSSLDTLPMNRLLGFGAQFLKEYYSSWVQEQGGYEIAFVAEDEVE